MNIARLIFDSKLTKLERQIEIARRADYSYPDGRDALGLLLYKIKRTRSRVAEAEGLSLSIQTSIYRDANFLISRVTDIVGIITRSTSVRSAFEFYAPFLEISKNLVGESAHLILSSEWSYVPFTYPQTLEDLPDFILIGLPASESDNVLVLPAAGHELGHTIWLKRRISDSYEKDIKHRIDGVLTERRSDFEVSFPDLKGADLDQDMFVQYIKSQIYQSCIAQFEEIFSDFIGLSLFGESYFYAFQYLVAPRLSGIRSLSYPDTLARAQMIAEYTNAKFSVDVGDCKAHFLADDASRDPRLQFVTQIADAVVSKFIDNLYEAAHGIIASQPIATPKISTTVEVEERFRIGIPFDGEASLGDIINAGWRVFRSDNQKQYSLQGRSIIEYISDLSLKSIELCEIRKIMRD
ncbi:MULTISPECIES: hypothetical protein [unclassified Chelatococcus]|uniref:hypothetical protein n=1 Tax=unclassified Chelatococcus TaxID=2638111 RepID=UPI001BCB7D52|nr:MULTISPECIES: hypothetical protein [unclassified Chelatococcus]MBS7697566.1 hypothetical protein [Chelatococcus sp. YT9]MBX3559359.1 hypothetical protein [Chelatococcus sp.]